MKSCNCCTTYSAPDLMDGGVAAALIEKEVAGSYTRTDEEVDPRETVEFWKGAANVAKRRAEKAEQERDEARREARGWQRDALTEVQNHRIVRNELDRLRAEQPRPLTADDITDEMVRQGHAALVAQTGRPQSVAAVEAVLTAALTEPTRPEWADLADVIRETTYHSEPDDLARALHHEGVRVTGAGS